MPRVNAPDRRQALSSGKQSLSKLIGHLVEYGKTLNRRTTQRSRPTRSLAAKRDSVAAPGELVSAGGEKSPVGGVISSGDEPVQKRVGAGDRGWMSRVARRIEGERLARRMIPEGRCGCARPSSSLSLRSGPRSFSLARNRHPKTSLATFEERRPTRGHLERSERRARPRRPRRRSRDVFPAKALQRGNRSLLGEARDDRGSFRSGSVSGRLGG